MSLVILALLDIAYDSMVNVAGSMPDKPDVYVTPGLGVKLASGTGGSPFI